MPLWTPEISAGAAAPVPISTGLPRPDPYVRLSRIRLPPRVCDGKCFAQGNGGARGTHAGHRRRKRVVFARGWTLRLTLTRYSRYGATNIATLARRPGGVVGSPSTLNGPRCGKYQCHASC